MHISVPLALFLLLPACKGPLSVPPPMTDSSPTAASSNAPPTMSAAAVASRTTIPANSPHTTLQGSSAHRVDLGARGTGFFWPAIFLNGNVSKAPGPVYLHLEGITGTPGSEADVYLLDRTSNDVEPKLYIGSFTLATEPPMRPVIVMEVKDFERDGQVCQARTKLREIAHFALALVVKRGSVSVERLVLTTASEADRIPGNP